MLGKGKAGDRNDYELFVRAFQKPTQIYKFLSYRHHVNPLFLHRTLSYMPHRMSRPHKSTKSLEEVVKQLSKKAASEERVKSREGSFKLTITDIADKTNSGAEAYDVRVYLKKIGGSPDKERKRRKISLREKQTILKYFDEHPGVSFAEASRILGYHQATLRLIKVNEDKYKKLFAKKMPEEMGEGGEVEPEPLAELKFTPNQKRRSPTKITAATTIRASTINKHSSGKGCSLEVRVKLRAAATTTEEPAESSPSKKRRCVEEWYGAELTLRNETQTTLVGDGRYTLYLRRLETPGTEGGGEGWKPSQQGWVTLGETKERSRLLTGDHQESSTCSSVTLEIKTDHMDGRRHTPRKRHSAGPPSPVKIEEAKGVVMYNFLYNGNTQQQTECRQGRTCPWCSLNCQQLYSLLEHITRCHPRFKVTFIPGLNGFDEVDVEVNEWLALGQDDDEEGELEGLGVFGGRGPVKKRPYTHLMEGSLTRVQRSVSDFMTLNIMPYSGGAHNRLYFHSNSYQAIKPEELGYDSEKEGGVMGWIEEKTKQLIQDFTDVNEGEKEVMILWNCFILKEKPLADSAIPGLVGRFVEERGSEIRGRNLTNNFILHLSNLHSFGLLRAEELEGHVLSLYQQEEMDETAVKVKEADLTIVG